MAIKPTPTVYTCPKCHWHKMFSPVSDRLTSMPHSQCKKCGCDALDSLTAEIGNLFK